MHSFYQVLGVDEGAGDEAVRLAYLRAAARSHPDRVRPSRCSALPRSHFFPPGRRLRSLLQGPDGVCGTAR